MRVGQFNNGKWTSGGSSIDYDLSDFKFLCIIDSDDRVHAVKEAKKLKRKMNGISDITAFYGLWK